MKEKKRRKKRFFLLGVIGVYAILQALTFHKESNSNTLFKNKNGFPLIIAHRGAKDLFPENTAYAFEHAMTLNIDALELDVRLTKDNQLITIHDDTIDRTSDGTGFVKDYTYEEIKQFNFGAKFVDLNGNKPFESKNDQVIPIRLEELFQKYAKKTLFLVEIKDDGELGKKAADQIKQLLDKYDINDQVNVTTFHSDVHDYYQTVRNQNNPITASQARATNMVYSMYGGWDFALSYGFEGMQFPTTHIVPLDTSYLIYKMHKHNLFVHFWTINDEKTMKELIAKQVDGIITDRPDLLLQLKNNTTR